LLPYARRVKLGFVSKHELYFPPIKRALLTLQASHDATYVTDFEELVKRDQNFDYVFFPHFSKLVPKSFYSRFVCVGFHVGNLPEDRGGSPIQNKILRGEYKTFVNAFKIDSSIDGGPVYEQKEIDLETGNITQIIENVSQVIASMIAKIVSEKTEPIPQLSSPTRFRRLTKKDSKFNFGELSVKQIFDRIRMVDGLDYPRAELECQSKLFKFTNARLENEVLVFECEVRNDPEKR